MSTTQARDAAQLFVINPDFRVQRRTCHVCGREDEVIRFVRPREGPSPPAIGM
jgi:hypothetical protein